MHSFARTLHFVQFEKLLESSSTKPACPMLANSIVVFMVRGLFTSLEFPYTQFSTRDVSGCMHAVFIANSYLVLIQHKYHRWFTLSTFLGSSSTSWALWISCYDNHFDRASVDRRLLKIHCLGPNAELLYKFINPYAPDKRYLYFISNPLHLMKTVRNYWASPNRHTIIKDMHDCRSGWNYNVCIYFK